MFLEYMIFRRSGTNLLMFTIVCTMYLKVRLHINVHSLLSLFNKQMKFDKKSCFFRNNATFHRNMILKNRGTNMFLIPIARKMNKNV